MTIKEKLRDDWKKAHKFISVQALALQAGLMVAWPMIPPDLKAHLPDKLQSFLAYGLLALTLYGVMTKQKGLKDESSDS